MLLLAAALTILETLTLQGPLHHVQGIDIEGGILWVSAVDKEAHKGYLFRLDAKTGKILAKTEVQDGDRYHPGGLTLDGDHLWLPVAEYRRNSTAVIQLRNKKTLELIRQFPVQDHIGCIAATNDKLIGGNWDSLDLYEWTKDGRQTNKRPNPTGGHYQDLKVIDGQLLAGGLLSKGKGAIDWLDVASLKLLRREEVPQTDRGIALTNEGITLRHGHIYLLPEDAPSRLFRVRVN